MRKALVVVGMTVVVAVAAVWSWGAFGPRSAWFAFLAVWLPVAWFAVVGQAFRLRLPDRVYALRPVERDGRVYELLGVRYAKRLLRRGPLAVLAPALRLPAEPTPQALAQVEDRMREAEAVHGILLVATFAAVAAAASVGWWDAAGWLLLFDVLVNGYPTMLQRYNRALLARRFAGVLPGV
jgi:hypothetical protein